MPKDRKGQLWPRKPACWHASAPLGTRVLAHTSAPSGAPTARTGRSPEAGFSGRIGEIRLSPALRSRLASWFPTRLCDHNTGAYFPSGYRLPVLHVSDMTVPVSALCVIYLNGSSKQDQGHRTSTLISGRVCQGFVSGKLFTEHCKWLWGSWEPQ